MTVVDFFSDFFFDEFDFVYFSEKRYWARCFGKRFGSSGGVREGFLGHPGGVQEASWEVLGLSGGVRGASWESLGLPFLPQRPRNNSELSTLHPPSSTLNLT